MIHALASASPAAALILVLLLLGGWSLRCAAAVLLGRARGDAVLVWASVVLAGLWAAIGPAEADPLPSLSGTLTADMLMPGLTLLGGVAGAGLAAGLWRLVTRLLDIGERLLGLHADAQQLARLHAAIDEGVRMILAAGEPVAARTIAAHVGAGNVARAVDLVLDLAPAAVAHMGVSADVIESLIKARLGDVLPPAAGSDAAAAPAAAPDPAAGDKPGGR